MLIVVVLLLSLLFIIMSCKDPVTWAGCLPLALTLARLPWATIIHHANNDDDSSNNKKTDNGSNDNKNQGFAWLWCQNSNAPHHVSLLAELSGLCCKHLKSCDSCKIMSSILSGSIVFLGCHRAKQ